MLHFYEDFDYNILVELYYFYIWRVSEEMREFFTFCFCFIANFNGFFRLDEFCGRKSEIGNSFDLTTARQRTSTELNFRSLSVAFWFSLEIIAFDLIENNRKSEM